MPPYFSKHFVAFSLKWTHKTINFLQQHGRQLFWLLLVHLCHFRAKLIRYFLEKGKKKKKSCFFFFQSETEGNCILMLCSFQSFTFSRAHKAFSEISLKYWIISLRMCSCVLTTKMKQTVYSHKFGEREKSGEVIAGVELLQNYCRTMKNPSGSHIKTASIHYVDHSAVLLHWSFGKYVLIWEVPCCLNRISGLECLVLFWRKLSTELEIRHTA